MKPAVPILGIPFPPLTRAEALRRMSKLIEKETPACVFTPNPQILMKAHRSPELRQLLLGADLLLPDGVGVTLAARLSGTPLPDRITGIDTAEWLLRYGAKRGYSFYFLGGKKGIAQDAARRMTARIPSLRVIGTHHGYFEKTGAENAKVLADVQTAKPDILFVCFGFPAQERWIAENLPFLPSVKLAMGLGGTLDVWSGNVKRAPKAVRVMGMEWLWRAVREPKRLKELAVLPQFLITALKNEKKTP